MILLRCRNECRGFEHPVKSRPAWLPIYLFYLFHNNSAEPICHSNLQKLPKSSSSTNLIVCLDRIGTTSQRRRETTQYMCGQTQPPLANKPDLAADKSPAKAIVFLKTCPASVSSKGIWHHISFVQIGGWAKFNYTDVCISLGCHANCQRWLANEPRPDLLRLSHSEGIMGHPVMSFAMTHPPCFSTPHILPSSGHRRKAFEKHLQAR